MTYVIYSEECIKYINGLKINCILMSLFAGKEWRQTENALVDIEAAGDAGTN